MVDLKSAYLQIQLAEDSRAITSFTPKHTRYQFTRVPFGLKIAPSFFQRKIQMILQKEKCN